MKRILAIILTVILLLAVTTACGGGGTPSETPPASSPASEPTERPSPEPTPDATKDPGSTDTGSNPLPADLPEASEDDFGYMFDSDTGGTAIMQYTGTAQKVRLPEKIQGDPVTVIGNSTDYISKEVKGAFQGSNVTYVYIPGSVTVIGDFAFMDCKGLTDITIPDSVKTIGQGAFFGCDSLPAATRSKIEAINPKAYESPDNGGSNSAPQPVDGPIVGIWEGSNEENPMAYGMIYEFMADGHIKTVMPEWADNYELGGTYRLEGNSLRIMFENAADEAEYTYVINGDTLTLTFVSDGAVIEFTRK